MITIGGLSLSPSLVPGLWSLVSGLWSSVLGPLMTMAVGGLSHSLSLSIAKETKMMMIMIMMIFSTPSPPLIFL